MVAEAGIKFGGWGMDNKVRIYYTLCQTYMTQSSKLGCSWVLSNEIKSPVHQVSTDKHSNHTGSHSHQWWNVFKLTMQHMMEINIVYTKSNMIWLNCDWQLLVMLISYRFYFKCFCWYIWINVCITLKQLMDWNTPDE